MNDKRRRQLREIEAQLDTCRALLEEVKDREQEAFDAMPESRADSERGKTMQSAIDAMDQALQSIEEAKDSITEATE